MKKYLSTKSALKPFANLLIVCANLMASSACFAAGYVTNKDFNELIESTTTSQRKTASAITEGATSENSALEYARQIRRESNDRF